MELLTTDEALKYLEDVLGISATEVPSLSDKSVPDGTKLSFLEKLIRAFIEREPFQSFCLMSHDIEKRRRPSWDEIKRDLLSGRGGLCYWLNAFMYALLTALGCDASLTYSTYDVGRYSPNNHLIVLLHDLLTPGSLHLVDVGTGYSIPRVISLDFSLESEEFTDSFMTYKFQKESDTAMYLLKKIDQNVAAASSARNADTVKNHQQDQQISKDEEEGKKNLQDNRNGIEQTINKEGDLQINMNQLTINNECDQQKHTNHLKVTNENQQQDAEINQQSTLNGIKADASSQQVTWQKLYIFNPSIALKGLEPFFQCFDENFTDVTRLSTHSSPRAMCWPGGRFLGIVNSNLIQELEPGKLTKTRIVDVVVSRTSSENKSNKSSNDAAANDKDDVSESNTSTSETPDKVHEKNATETVTNSNGTDSVETKNKTDNQEQVQLSDLDPLVEAYAHYFPQFPKQMVQDALKNWIATGTLFPVPPHLA
ncbi:hypothetical protein BsWGS_08944 [Bradybaena similaris]